MIAEPDTDTLSILLVEDNPAEADLLIESFAQHAFAPQVCWLNNGRDALNYLFRHPPHENAPQPDFVLLDLNLPQIDGFEVLSAVRRHPKLPHIPVIILTTSDLSYDHVQCDALGARFTLTKPYTLAEYARLIDHLMDYMCRQKRTSRL